MQEGDEKLSSEVQAEIVSLTAQWYAATTQAEKDRIHNLANDYRSGTVKPTNEISSKALQSDISAVLVHGTQSDRSIINNSTLGTFNKASEQVKDTIVSGINTTVHVNYNNQVFTNVDTLSTLANTYSNNNASSSQQLVLQYVRQFNKDYTTSKWDVVAGKIDSSFIEFVRKNNPELEEFLKSATYLYDPSSGQKIDFTHMAATLNALLYDSKGFEAFVAGEKNVDNLAGWAGDLQTLVKDVIKDTKKSNNYKTLYSSASSLMGNEKYSFGMSDLLADVDAVNINDVLGTSSIGSALRSYYSSGYNDRYTNFVENITGNNKKSSLSNLSGAYTNDMFTFFKKWPLLKGVDVTNNQSKAVRDAFTNFIWNKVQSEK